MTNDRMAAAVKGTASRRIGIAGLAVAALLAAASFVPGIAFAGDTLAGRSAKAFLDIRIVVAPLLQLRTIRQPAHFEVTARDAAAGFVDLEGGMELEIRSNLRTGHSVLIGVNGALVKAAEISGLGMPVSVTSAPASVQFPRRAPGTTPSLLSLGFRLRLADGVTPGVYPWPVSMTVSPT